MIGNTPTISVVFYLIAAVLGAIGQYLYKEGAAYIKVGVANSTIANPRILLGVLCYIGVMCFFVLAFKKGGQLTILYPIYATTFIWAALIGIFILGEQFNLYKILGSVLIILGVVCVVR
jgi:drug/metabolite transporter (DMT)-like permease